MQTVDQFVPVARQLREMKRATASDLGVPKTFMNSLAEQGLVEQVGTRKHVNPETGQPSRGRPSHEFALTRKGRDKARRAEKATA
jgi:predicted ArsR family transcriptional regulator